MVSDEDFENRDKKFPIHTPRNKEGYWYRQIFESHFPGDQAALTVPHALSIACSTEKALEWDEAFKRNADESGRAVLGVHVKAENLVGVA